MLVKPVRVIAELVCREQALIYEGLSGLVSFYDYQQGTHISKLFQQLNILYIYRTFLL